VRTGRLRTLGRRKRLEKRSGSSDSERCMVAAEMVAEIVAEMAAIAAAAALHCSLIMVPGQ
tara:strand:+ start:1903 stop:2085 length:183 start_codon:yes stop_codon:yes gene_type:complete